MISYEMYRPLIIMVMGRYSNDVTRLYNDVSITDPVSCGVSYCIPSHCMCCPVSREHRTRGGLYKVLLDARD